MTPEVQLTVTNLDGNTAMLDLYENESVALTWRYSDIKSLEVKGAYTKQFRVPVSPNNLAILGPLFDVNIETSQASFHKKCPASLQVATLPIEKGHIQIKRVVSRMHPKLPDIEIIFYAETPDLAKAIGQNKLADLDYSALTHEINFENVVNGDPDLNWMWALTDRGHKWSENGEPGTRRVLNVDDPVRPAEMTPCISAKWLFAKILSEAGFTYDTGTSGFDNIDNVLELYWIPYVTSLFARSALLPADYLFNTGYGSEQAGFTSNLAGTALTGMTEVFDNNGDLTSDIWTAPFTGTYWFKIRLSLDPVGSPSNELAYVRLKTPDGVTTHWMSSTININSGAVVNWQSPTIPLFLNEGTQVQMFLALSAGLTVDIEGGAGADDPNGTGWALVDCSTPVAGEDIAWSLNAPDMLQIDFIKDIVKMHNLAVIPDRNIASKIYFEPLGSYITSGAVKDWTGKLDRSKDVVIEPTTDAQSKKLVFTYRQGSDVISQLFKNRIYGDYQVEGYVPNSTGETNDFIAGETRIELQFASTPANIIGGTEIVVPKFVDSSGEHVAPGPRIMFQTAVVTIALYNDGAMTPGGELISVNTINHYSVSNGGLTEIDLNFAPETPFHPIVANPYNNLFNLYYRSYLNEIYSPGARFFEAYFDLSLTDILNFQFNDKIWIIDCYYRIIEISDYVVGDKKTTKVKLIKLIDATLDCAGTPSTSSVGGVVSFVDANDDPIDATELCCLRYGLFWQSGANYCSSFPTGGVIRPENSGFNAGFSTGNPSSPNYSFVLASNLNVPQSTIQSLLAGNNHDIAVDNPYTLAVGDTLKLTGSNPGTAMTGRNVLAYTSGSHVGGGWIGSDRSIEGRAQHSIIPFAADGTFAGAIELFIDGQSGKRLVLPNRTVLSCIMQVAVGQWNAAGTSWTETGHALYSFDISKGGTAPGTAAASAVNVIATDGFTALTLAIDVATDTDEHRFTLSDASGVSNIKISAFLKVVQLRQ